MSMWVLAFHCCVLLCASAGWLLCDMVPLLRSRVGMGVSLICALAGPAHAHIHARRTHGSVCWLYWSQYARTLLPFGSRIKSRVRSYAHVHARSTHGSVCWLYWSQCTRTLLPLGSCTRSRVRSYAHIHARHIRGGVC